MHARFERSLRQFLPLDKPEVFKQAHVEYRATFRRTGILHFSRLGRVADESGCHFVDCGRMTGKPEVDCQLAITGQ